MAFAVLMLLLGACSDDDSTDNGNGNGNGGTDEDEAADEFVDGPAPASWNDDAAYRVEDVSLDGEVLEVTITVAARDETRLDDDDIRLLTNTGVNLPRADEQQRTLPAGSLGTLTIRTDAVTEPIRSIELEVMGMSTKVDLPADGERLRWAPAPERQVGFTDGLMRDRSPVAIVPYTFRTEGLVSELTFLGITQGSSNASFCGCRLEDSSGNVYPGIGSSYQFADAQGSRVRGTLRFLGEIPPDETQFRLFIEGSSGFLTTPDPDLEFGFTLPRAEDSELSVAAADTWPEPFEVDSVIQNDLGLQVELGEMSFYDDRIQLDVRATATGESSWSLDYRGDSVLRDPSGYSHELARPAGGGELVVGAGDTVEASLVFLTPLAASATELHLDLAIAQDAFLRHTIQLPERPDPDEADEPAAEDDGEDDDNDDDNEDEDEEGA